MSMITVDTARGILGIRERIRPAVDWDEVHANYVRRSREEATAPTATSGGATAQPAAAPLAVDRVPAAE